MVWDLKRVGRLEASLLLACIANGALLQVIIISLNMALFLVLSV